MRVAERLITHLFISHEARTSVVTAYALEIDQHAIAPAVAERDKRIAELVEALQAIAGTTMSHVVNCEHGFERCKGIARAVLGPKKGRKP